MREPLKRILTGIRPTGPLHLGHYAGYQVSDYADDIARVREAVWEVALDWLSVGLDPAVSHFVIESLVPEHAELALWLSLGRKSVPVAFFTYPVMQSANILMPRAHLVPVGEDQLPHVELTPRGSTPVQPAGA